MKIQEDNSTNGSSSYFVTKKSSQECNLIPVPHDETRFALLANIFMCEGKPGQVRKIQFIVCAMLNSNCTKFLVRK